jgi:hypothetical protein
MWSSWQVEEGDVIILSIPFWEIPPFAGLFVNVPDEVVVIDTSVRNSSTRSLVRPRECRLFNHLFAELDRWDLLIVDGIATRRHVIAFNGVLGFEQFDLLGFFCWWVHRVGDRAQMASTGRQNDPRRHRFCGARWDR